MARARRRKSTTPRSTVASGRIVIDGMDELHRFVARVNGRGADVLLRFNTGIEAHTHDFIRTAGDRSKFGFAPSEADEAFALLREQPTLRVRGVHAHMGSQIYDAMPYVENARRLRELLERMRAAGFDAADTIIIGGGFGVQMRPDAKDETIDIAGTLDAVARIVPSDIHVEIEPGRALIAAAGTSIYRVMAVKRFEGRRFVIVDGSMADNPRPALYGAYHHFEAVEPRTPLAPGDGLRPFVRSRRTRRSNAAGRSARRRSRRDAHDRRVHLQHVE